MKSPVRTYDEPTFFILKICNFWTGSPRLARDSVSLPRVGAAELLYQDLGGWLEGADQASICRPDPQGCEGNSGTTAGQERWDEKPARDMQNAW